VGKRGFGVNDVLRVVNCGNHTSCEKAGRRVRNEKGAHASVRSDR